MLAPNKNTVALANKITELSVRLNVTEEQNRLLREENQRLQQIELAHQKLKSEHQQTVERKVLLEEEVRWLKAQYYGRSTQATDAAEHGPDQQMLLNEAEVLAAIEAADRVLRQMARWGNLPHWRWARRCRQRPAALCAAELLAGPISPEFSMKNDGC